MKVPEVQYLEIYLWMILFLALSRCRVLSQTLFSQHLVDDARFQLKLSHIVTRYGPLVLFEIGSYTGPPLSTAANALRTFPGSLVRI